jgi:hypothetical protein
MAVVVRQQFDLAVSSVGPQAVPKANKTNQSRQDLAELFSPVVAFL